MNDLQERINNDDLLLEKPTTSYQKTKDSYINHIKELLASECINPDRVTIICRQNPQSPLSTSLEMDETGLITHTIKIDKEWLQEHTPEIQDAIIRHEMVHLTHYDSMEGGYMIYTITQNGYTRDEYEKSKAVRYHRHLREIRADTLAGIQDITIAKALQQDFANCIATQQEDIHGHPSNAQRYEKITELIACLEQEEQSLA